MKHACLKIVACVLAGCGMAHADQRIALDGNAVGPKFDGVGAVSA